jgi:hypothetical protein
MSLKRFVSVLAEDLPVLFCYIGWAEQYDGTEHVVGRQRFLKDHPTECSEREAFKKVDNWFYCGIWYGAAPQPFHIVFVALDPWCQKRKIVGLYAGAEIELNKNDWAEAYAKNAKLIPVDKRPILTVWPPGQGQRRWASRQSGRQYSALRRVFENLKRDRKKPACASLKRLCPAACASPGGATSHTMGD